MSWTTQDHNNNDIRNRTKKINEIGTRLSEFFDTSVNQGVTVTSQDTSKLTTRFEIAVSSPTQDTVLLINVLGNGKIQLQEQQQEKSQPRAQRQEKPKRSTIHEFEIRTNYDLGLVFSHTVFEMAEDEVCVDTLNKYGVDIAQGLKTAQQSTDPVGKARNYSPRPPYKPKGSGRGLV